MLKSFNKLEIERGYISVSFHKRSIFYMLYFVLRRSLVLIHTTHHSGYSTTCHGGEAKIFMFFYKSCKLYKITKITKNPAQKTIDQLDKNSNG
jgi:hypothetical protein